MGASLCACPMTGWSADLGHACSGRPDYGRTELTYTDYKCLIQTEYYKLNNCVIISLAEISKDAD